MLTPVLILSAIGLLVTCIMGYLTFKEYKIGNSIIGPAAITIFLLAITLLIVFDGQHAIQYVNSVSK